MDLQGTPIGSTSQGTKVRENYLNFPSDFDCKNPLGSAELPFMIPTNKLSHQNTSDPEAYSNPKEEGAGVVLSDSLAAESARDGSEFAQNRNVDISTGSSNPLNTDLSGATTLAPAPDAAEREAKAAWQETSGELKGPGGQKYAEALGGQGEFPGGHNADGYYGGSTKAKQEFSSRDGDQGPQRESTDGGAVKGGVSETTNIQPQNSANEQTTDPQPRNDVDPAPSYVVSATSQLGRAGNPKGRNITEGGFDDTDASKNASFTADIGSENDPGREAEGQFQRRTNAVAGDIGPRQGGISGDGQYDVLEGEKRL